MEEFYQCNYWWLLLSPTALRALNSIEEIANFNDNPITTIIFCYSPTNVSDIEDVYKSLSSLARLVPKFSNNSR